MEDLNEQLRTGYPLLGKRVVVTGTSRKGLNGKAGMATSFDRARGVYVVSFSC